MSTWIGNMEPDPRVFAAAGQNLVIHCNPAPLITDYHQPATHSYGYQPATHSYGYQPATHSYGYQPATHVYGGPGAAGPQMRIIDEGIAAESATLRARVAELEAQLARVREAAK